MMKIQLILIFATIFSGVFAQNAVIDNGVIRREISLNGNHILGNSYTLSSEKSSYIRSNSPEFSVLIDDIEYSGFSEWADIQYRDISKANGRGIVITFSKPDKSLSFELVYMTYPKLPVIRKSLTIINNGLSDVKVEAVDVEHIRLNWSPIESWVMRQYARYKWLGPYIGNWDDPLIVVHDISNTKGIAIGNEAIGIIKRTTAFTDGGSLTAGLTHPDQDYPFRKWLKPEERWTSPWIFTTLYDNCSDPAVVVNTHVQDFVRKYMGTRIEELPKKPMFVYNTWHPFRREINEKIILELAKAAAECGVEEFIIDDGWQLNVRSEEGKPEYQGDWEIDKKKFPNGLKPVFDYIKSLGMKPGLWISLATADPSSIVYQEHPEWFVVGPDGQLTDLHHQNASSRTACFGTEWFDYIKNCILKLVNEHGLAYIKLDLAILASAYVYSIERTGCYATDHPHHKDRAESFDIIYRRCMQLFDELHKEAPELFIDCTFETAGKMQLMDYGIALHAEGNWLSNVQQPVPTGSLRIRNLSWGRSPALPATSLVIGNLSMDEKYHELGFKSLTGSLPIMLGDPRKLSPSERNRYKQWSDWLKKLEAKHSYMSYRQDLPGMGEPAEGAWDGFCRLNTETGSGGLVGVFKQGAKEKSRVITIPWLDSEKTYIIKQGFLGNIVGTMTGKKLMDEGFQVTLNELYDGELFEISQTTD